jgi:hypothetical protein
VNERHEVFTMYEFTGIALGLFLLAIASGLGSPDHAVKRDFGTKPVVIVALR